MKKIIPLLFVLLLVACQYRNPNTITINRKESNFVSTIYDLNRCENMKIEIYQLIGYEWNLIHSNQLEEECAKLSIDLHRHNNSATKKEYYLQYYTFDKDNNELSDAYSLVYINDDDLSFNARKADNIEYESSQANVIALFEWGNNHLIPLDEIKLDQKYESEYAYLIVLS